MSFKGCLSSHFEVEQDASVFVQIADAKDAMNNLISRQ
jgi:hypothetical protein